MRFVSLLEAAQRVRGRRVALVGSGPSVLQNDPGFIDSHDVVVRVNNYKLGPAQGARCDVFYSFFGGSIRKSAEELRRDGVALCLCKVPNSRPISSPWHAKRGKEKGIDFRYIFALREGWWFCDTFVPDDEHFLYGFELLGKHVPTSGFSALLDLLRMGAGSVYLTGFDFFSSRIHNVDEPWRAGDPSDPIKHVPEKELEWVARNAGSFPIEFDATIDRLVATLRNEKG